jgi:sporulation protein YlmC with PRC-barrel domain
MKRIKPSIVLSATAFVAVACACMTPVSAQEAIAAAASASMTPAERHDWERSHRVSRVIGTDVHTKGGEKIGEIRDIVIDDKGQITLAIVSTGGFLGVGDRLHAVPWQALTLGPKDDHVLDIDRAHLKEAPGFNSKTWPNLGDERWMADNRRYYIH